GAVAAAQVNSSVTFVRQPATFNTDTDENRTQMACGTGFAGTFSFQALLTVKAGQAPLEAPKAQITKLGPGNGLLVADGGVAGAAGTQYSFAEVGKFSDEQLAAGESLLVPFVICLKTLKKFAFFVNVLGHPLPEVGGEPGQGAGGGHTDK